MSIYAIAYIMLFWFNFRLIIYCIIIDMVVLGYTGAPFYVIIMLVALG
jgi:hypothetical protein